MTNQIIPRQRFQSGITEMFRLAGKDGTEVLKRARHWYQLTVPRRQRLLQFWETQHMAMHDKNQYRPRQWRLKRPPSRSLQSVEETFKRKAPQSTEYGSCIVFRFLKCVCLTKDREGDDHFCRETSHVFPSTKVVSLRRLLLRWDRVLKTEARLVAKARREMLRQRQNARKERRRAARAAETAWRKRLEAAKLRRQAQEQMRNPHV